MRFSALKYYYFLIKAKIQKSAFYMAMGRRGSSESNKLHLDRMKIT